MHARGQGARSGRHWPHRAAVPLRAQFLATLLMLVAGELTGPGLAAAGPPSAAVWPPMTYPLDEARVSVQRVAAHGLSPQRVVVAGSGDGRLERQGQSATFGVDRDSAVKIINALYGMRFFDLPAYLLPQRSVFRKDDGSVGTQAMKQHDATVTTVCFTLPGYEKCVVYEANPPRELEELVQRLLADSELRVALPAPPKQ